MACSARNATQYSSWREAVNGRRGGGAKAPSTAGPWLSRSVVTGCGKLQGSFSAVSKRNFASNYALESSRRDLHNALVCTALKSHFFLKSC